MNATQVLDCGHYPTPTRYTTGYGRDDNGRTFCFDCDGRATRERMRVLGRVTAYISTDGQHVTTWPGSPLARVLEHRVTRTGFGRSEVHYWRARDAYGRYWYGRNGGPGMVLTMRAYARKAPSRAETFTVR